MAVTLDSDVEALIRERMREQGVSCKQVVNDAIRAGLGGGMRSDQIQTRSTSMGVPAIDLDHALRHAAEIEDEELVRAMDIGNQHERADHRAS